MDPRRPLPLEYANRSDEHLVDGEPPQQRLVLGMLSLIGSVAAGALMGLGVAMRGGGVSVERRLGGMSLYTSLAVAGLALWVALAARTRAREARGVANLALAANVAYWVVAGCLLLGS